MEATNCISNDACGAASPQPHIENFCPRALLISLTETGSVPRPVESGPRSNSSYKQKVYF
jgi:hypothetical protein